MLKERLPKYLWFAYAVAISTWTICIYCELGRIYRDHELFAKNVAGQTFVSDFAVFYNAARLTKINCSERKLNVYSPKEQELGLREVTAPVVPELPLLAIYPPYFFAMVAPLSLVPLNIAWFFWCFCGAVSALAAIWYSSRSDCWRSFFSRYVLFVAIFASFPCWLSFKLGQVSLFLPAGLTLFWYLIRQRRFALAGLVSVACILKVQYLPMLAVAGLVRGRLRYVLGAGATMLALLCLSYFVLGLDNMLSFPEAVRYNETAHAAGGVSPHMMQNFRGMLTLIVGEDNALVHMLSMGLFVLAFVCVGALWWSLRKHSVDSQAFRLGAAATIIILLIASPHTHTQDYFALVPAAIWLWEGTADDASKAAKWVRGLLLALPFLSWSFFMTQFIWFLLRLQPLLLWACVLLCLIFVLLRAACARKSAVTCK